MTPNNNNNSRASGNRRMDFRMQSNTQNNGSEQGQKIWLWQMENTNASITREKA
jgi:hypothetical protein